MAIDKAAMPFLPEEGGENITIAIENPESVGIMTEDGGMVFEFGPEQTASEFGDNLAELIDERDLMALAVELISQFEGDKDSRKDWEKTYMKGLDLLGLKFEDRSTPWDGACGVFHPMLSESVVRFQAQTIQEIFPAVGPVKTSIVGKIDNEKTKQAARVQELMNYISTQVMSEYRTETEKLLFSLPIAGSAFRKVYYDPALGRPCAMFVPAEDFVVSYGASDLVTCGRYTHVMKKSSNDVRKFQVAGFYRDVDLPAPQPDFGEIERKYNNLTGESEDYDLDSRHTLLEMHVECDIPGFEDPDGVALPYIVTIDKSSKTVLSIRRNWLEDDDRRLARQHFAHFQYLPGFGFYGFGLVHMIGGLSKSATSLLRQLVDAGTLSNLPGGLKTRGLRIKGDDTPIMPGEFRDVDVPSGAIRDNITFMPYKEPSNVLYNLLRDIVGEGRRFATAADVKASDINGEAPVGTTLAVLEREMKVMSAVQARIHAAMGKELRILAGIIREYGPFEYPYEQEEEKVAAEDFDDRVDIIPVSDPNAGTMAQRIMQYQAALQLSQAAPQMYDIPLLHRQMLEVLGIPDAARIIPTEDDAKPTDPVTENMAIINGKPVKAFKYQDHEAHIQVHMSALQNPELMGLLAKAPNAKAIQAAASAHIAEHVAFAYRRRIELELGVELPSEDEALPEDIELRISRLAVPAAEQLTGKAQQQQQAEKNAQMQQDPVIQMQMQDLEIKKQKAIADHQEKMAKLDIEAKKAYADAVMKKEDMESRERMKSAELAARLAQAEEQTRNNDAERATRLVQTEEQINAQKELAGFKAGFEAVQNKISGDEDDVNEVDND